MRFAQVIGNVTLGQCHPSFRGASLRLAVPLSQSDLRGQSQPAADEIVIYDQLGAGVGSLIAFSEGAEAAQPFRPEIKPVDAYNAAIIDQLELE
jgi:ethanolamine utilization protein EutN